jgi:4-diphosphocytidyl-2-C-methyl-D-erythritol kinase
MNKLLKLNISEQKLMDLGCKIGADVPFFIFQKTAIAEGIGEKLTHLPQMPKCWQRGSTLFSDRECIFTTLPSA